MPLVSEFVDDVIRDLHSRGYDAGRSRRAQIMEIHRDGLFQRWSGYAEAGHGDGDMDSSPQYQGGPIPSVVGCELARLLEKQAEETSEDLRVLMECARRDPDLEGKYVAILNGRVIDSDSDAGTLVRRLLADGDRPNLASQCLIDRAGTCGSPGAT